MLQNMYKDLLKPPDSVEVKMGNETSCCVHISSEDFPKVSSFKPGETHTVTMRMTSKTEEEGGSVCGDFDIVSVEGQKTKETETPAEDEKE